jgi:protein-disulfide isomerase
VNITRRGFALAAVATALLGGGMLAGSSIAGLERTASAQNSVPVDELNKPGPLGDIALGNDDAPITIVEYASMTCPHCAHFSEAIFPELKKKYIDTGKVRFIMREFPLDQLAAAGFMLARCAGKDRYYPMIETLFATQREWVVQRPLQPLMKIAKQAGMSEQAFNDCLKDEKILNGINEVRDRGSKVFKVDSTPTFFINGNRLSGAQDLSEFEKAMAPFLKS